jgi:DNA-binding NtrC family response regulator
MNTLPQKTTLSTDPMEALFPTSASLRERVRQTVRQAEAEIIIETLERHRWNRRRTAEELKISYRSLMYKMKHCNLRNEAVVDRVRSGLKTSCGG